MNIFLGIDLGTTGLKTALFDEAARMLGRGYAANPYLSSGEGRAEQDPEQWWHGCCQAIEQAFAASGVQAERISALGVCGFHHCPVFLDRSGRPARPSIVTHDRRLEGSLAELKQSGILQEIEEKTGSRVTTGHFPAIYHYLLTHEPEVIESARWVLLAKDYLRYRLTERIGTELCDATGTHLVAMPEQDWSASLCRLLQVSAGKLPAIGRSERIFGEVTSKAARETGLRPGTPVVYGGGDSHCALLGLGVIEPGQVGLLLGTNSTLRSVFDEYQRLPDPPVWTQQHVVPELFTASASSLAGASVLSWFKDALFAGEKEPAEDEAELFHRLDSLAAGADPGAEGLLFLPYIFGERSPFSNPRARGAFLAIGHEHRLAHFARSVMEGVAYATANNLGVLAALPLLHPHEPASIRIGRGGGSLSATWRKILADVLDLPLEVVGIEEPGCLGAALLAGIGIGAYSDAREAVERAVKVESVTSPEEELASSYRERRERFNRAYEAIEPVLYR